MSSTTPPPSRGNRPTRPVGGMPERLAANAQRTAQLMEVIRALEKWVAELEARITSLEES